MITLVVLVAEQHLTAEDDDEQHEITNRSSTPATG